MVKAVVVLGFNWGKMVCREDELVDEEVSVHVDPFNKTPVLEVVRKALTEYRGDRPYPKTYCFRILKGSEYVSGYTPPIPAKPEPEQVKVFNAIIPTSSRTEVYREKDFQFNAPHHFVVKSKWGKELAKIDFQEGPIADSGVNGVTNEDLIAIVIERLNGFQESQFRCRDNALAITHLEEALFRLANRTREREARGVEGTHTV